MVDILLRKVKLVISISSITSNTESPKSITGDIICGIFCVRDITITCLKGKDEIDFEVS